MSYDLTLVVLTTYGCMTEFGNRQTRVPVDLIVILHWHIASHVTTVGLLVISLTLYDASPVQPVGKKPVLKQFGERIPAGASARH